MDWTEHSDVEVIEGKVSGAHLLKGTRLPVEAITDNYDAFVLEGMTPEEAVLETSVCYPHIDPSRIRSVLEYRAAFEHQLQR